MGSQERRELSFSNWDEVIADIESLASGSGAPQVAGSHSFASIVRHLAITNEMVVGDQVPPKLPWYMRMAMLLLRNSILNNPVKPGFKLPNAQMQAFFWPEEEVSASDAIDRFKASVARYNQAGPLPVHPIFGKATAQQVDTLSLSHAAMHLSFVQPG